MFYYIPDNDETNENENCWWSEMRGPIMNDTKIGENITVRLKKEKSEIIYWGGIIRSGAGIGLFKASAETMDLKSEYGMLEDRCVSTNQYPYPLKNGKSSKSWSISDLGISPWTRLFFRSGGIKKRMKETSRNNSPMEQAKINHK